MKCWICSVLKWLVDRVCGEKSVPTKEAGDGAIVQTQLADGGVAEGSVVAEVAGAESGAPVMADALFILSDGEEAGARVIELRLPVTLDVITFDDLTTAMVAEIDAQPGHYVIDLSGTDYAGSAVLGLLVNLRSRVKRHGGQLVLCQLSSRMMEIFRLGSLESIFTIVPTRAAAFELLK